MTEVEQNDHLAKSDLDLVFMAAWCNVTVDQLPAAVKRHPNDYTRQAWTRVAEAAAAPFQSEIKQLREALAWYEEQARICRKPDGNIVIVGGVNSFFAIGDDAEELIMP